MRVLITGADGFIGSRLFGYFSDRYPSVYGSVFYTEPAEDMFYLNMFDDDSFSNIPDIPFDVCIHAAGTVDQSLPSRTIMEINGGGTKKVLRRLGEVGCGHFIHLSSITVYGKRVVGSGRCEETRRKRRGLATIPYGRSKAAAEEYVESSTIPYTILRLPPVLGEKDTALTPALKSRFEKEDLFSCSGTEKKVSILQVEALPGYIDKLITAGPRNDSFNVASHHLGWDELLSLYTAAWKEQFPDAEVEVRRKSALSFLFHLRDKKYLLSAMFSAFGSHFPTDKLETLIPLETDCSCFEGVRSALRGCS